MSGPARPDGDARRYFGVYPALVVDIVDPESLGRVALKFPWLGADGDSVRSWATLLSPYAEDGQGFQVLPSVDTQVVVAFEAGDLRRPYIIGAAWNGREAMPEPPAAPNNKRLIKTRSGSLLEFDDTDGASKVTISMRSGHTLVLNDAAREVELTHANGHTIKFTASGQIEIQANSTVELTAAAFNVHAPMAAFDGIVTCTTMIASSGVVSPSYTPGAGNIW
ncbi:MAG: hypothetical protein IH602_19740 [Bryobacteraceae bacterium]|jgi:uncharacterized protein involved in type VI secretion and phage assembly|nr:hypothetical protein [Bryobacteraceae bacterium]